MRYIIKELRRHYWRTFFSIVSYCFVAFFILLIFCINGSNKKDSFGILKSTGTHFIVYIPTEENCCKSDKVSGTIFAEGVQTAMLDFDMLRSIKNIKGIKDAAPYLLYKMYNEQFKTEISIGGIDTTSVASTSNACAHTNVVAGRYLTTNPKEIVVEEAFSRAHNLLLGDKINIFGGSRKLAGIVNSGIKPAKADFYAPIEYVRTILKDELQCNAAGFDMNVILVEVVDSRLQDQVIDQVKKMMYKFSVSSYNCYEPANKVMSVIDKSSIFVTIIIFVFLTIFSAKTQITSLIERYREIGILKSLGWSDFELGTNILVVALIQSLIGVSTGLLSGVFVIMLLNDLNLTIFDLIDFHLSYSSFPLIYSLSLAGAIIASIFPIIKIYRTRTGEIINNYL